MKTQSHPLEVERGEGAYLVLKNGDRLLDAVSSWWCVIHGYNNTELNQAITDQLSKIAHVMLGGLTHNPAIRLAKKLVEITPGGLNHVFFSDSGSVGCEVAMKMAIQYWKNKGEPSKKRFIALKRGYHGDTLGVMSLGSDDETMHATFQDAVSPQFFVTPGDESELESLLKNHSQEIAGFFVEPLMQGAGGFYLHEPSYLKNAKTLCERHKVLVIADEVATGFGRTGTLFAVEQADFTPDIMILGKALTGGYLGLAATIATTDVFNSFYSEDSSKAFMHGPTFMGNALACSVALKSIELFERGEYLKKIKDIETQLHNGFKGVSHSNIVEVRIKGAMACIEVTDEALLKKSQEIAASNGVWLRPFGRFLYTMPPYIISEKELKKIIEVMLLCSAK